MASFRASAGYHIAITYAAVLAWAVLLLGAGAYYVIKSEFAAARDREIAAELHRLKTGHDRPGLARELQSYEQAPGAAYDYALFDPRGRRVAGSLALARPPEGAHDVSLGNGRSLRIGATTLDDGSRLVVAVSYDAVDRIELILLQFFLGAFIAILAISGAGGLVVAWYLRARLKPIEATANAIQTGDIAWRVAVGSRGDEFDKAGQAMNLMLDRIAGLMENLRQVSSDIAHDLRKPLIRLLHQTDRLGREEGAEQRVLELGDEMIALFAAILRIAEIEGGGLERGFTPVDLSTLMSEVAESFEPAFVDGGHRIAWAIAPDVHVNGNRELLAQVAANLLDNAMIHTPPGTEVVLGLAAEDGHARLWIEDNGPGVDEADRDKLLQRFFRAEASRTTPGNGLGLNLVAAIARAHGGRTEVEHAHPGLRITIRIPRLVGQEAPAAQDEGA
jgi:signal transduction histidine kinase